MERIRNNGIKHEHRSSFFPFFFSFVVHSFVCLLNPRPNDWNHKRKYRKSSVCFCVVGHLQHIFAFQMNNFAIHLCVWVCQRANGSVCVLVDCLLNWKCWCSIFNTHKCAIKTVAFFRRINATLTTVDGHEYNEQIWQKCNFSLFPLCESLSRAQFLLHHCNCWRCRHRHHHWLWRW